MKALIADDSAVMRKVLAGALQRVGIVEADQAADGAEALHAATAGQYDLIMMDWNMPKMLGIDVVKAIRSSGNKTPIIMVTTEAERSRLAEALQSGVNNYVIKPFDATTIIRKIRETLGDSLSAPSTGV